MSESPEISASPAWQALRKLGVPSLLILQWILMCLIANPVAEFPINDDWAHAAAVRAFLDTGIVRPPDWTATNFVAQLFWGALFSLPAGATHTALRISGLAAGLIGVLLTYRICRSVKASPGVSGAAAAALAANPIYFGLSGSFMTDIPFFAASMASLCLYLQALENGSRRTESAATLMAVIAILVRQTGLALPLAYGVALVFRNGLRAAVLLRGALISAACASVQWGYRMWLDASGRTPAMYGAQVDQLRAALQQPWDQVLSHYATQTAVVVLYLGLCCALPLALVLPGIVRRASRPLLVGGGIIAAGLAFFVLLHARGIRMPALGSTLAFDGFGPRILTLPPVTPLLWHGWTLITLVGSLACAGLAYLLVAPRPAGTEASRQSVAPAAMLLAFAGIYALPVLGLPIVFDRYLIPLAGCALALICLVTTASGSTPPGARALRLSALALACSSLFAALLFHDYLSWNRVRWQALDQLTRVDGVPPKIIDGGIEFNGSYLYTPDQKLKGPKGWFVADDQYAVALTGLPGYTVVRESPVPALLPFSPRRVLVLRRKTPPGTDVAPPP